MANFHPEAGSHISMETSTGKSTDAFTHTTKAVDSPGFVASVWLAGQIIDGAED